MNQNKLQVMYRGRLVGTLAAMPDKRIAYVVHIRFFCSGLAVVLSRRHSSVRRDNGSVSQSMVPAPLAGGRDGDLALVSSAAVSLSGCVFPGYAAVWEFACGYPESEL